MSNSDTPFQLELAPQKLWQAINPWFNNSVGDQIGLFNISLGRGDEDLERKILRDQGSYGKQLGHVSEALEVLVGVLRSIAPEKMESLSKEQQDAISIFMGDVAEIRKLKSKTPKGNAEPTATEKPTPS